MKVLYLLSFMIILLACQVSAAWNYSEQSTNVAAITASDPLMTNYRGMKFIVNKNMTLVSVTMLSGGTATKARLLDSSRVQIGSDISINPTTRIANWTAGQYNLTAGNSYYIVLGNSGAAYTYQEESPHALPIQSTYLNYTEALNGASAESNRVSNIQSIGVAEYYAGTVPAAISINITFPTNNLVLNVNSIDFNVSLTPTNINLTNATLRIHYQNNTQYTTSNKSITGTVTNYTTFSITSLPLGHYFFNYIACGINDSSSRLCFGSTNYTFTIGATINTQSYPNATYETDYKTFTAEIQLTSGASMALAQLVYDGVNYTVSNITVSNTTYALSRSLDIPTINSIVTNKSFFWRFTFSNSQIVQQETNQINVTVKKLFFSKCNATINVSTINFTVIDENSNSQVNAAFRSDFRYWLGNGGVFINYSYIDTSVTASKFGFCMDNSSLSIKLADGIEYSSTNYEPRTYFLLNATLNNTRQDINLSLLNNTASTKFFFTAYQGVDKLSNAYIYISKETVVGSNGYSLVSIRKTDDNGKFIEYLEEDKNYRIYAYRNGEYVGMTSITALCATAPCEQTLQLESGSSIADVFSTLIAGGVSSNLYYDEVDTVHLDYVDTTGLASYVRLHVYKITLNSTKDTICDSSLYSVSGTITCNVSAYQGDFKADVYISRSPEKIFAYIAFVRDEIANSLGKTGILIGIALFIIVLLAFEDIRAKLLAVPFVMIINKYLHLINLPYSVIAAVFVVVLFIISLGGKEK